MTHIFWLLSVADGTTVAITQSWPEELWEVFFSKFFLSFFFSFFTDIEFNLFICIRAVVWKTNTSPISGWLNQEIQKTNQCWYFPYTVTQYNRKGKIIVNISLNIMVQLSSREGCFMWNWVWERFLFLYLSNWNITDAGLLDWSIDQLL